MAHPTRNRLAMFNLAPPPNFRGLDPDKLITSYERHLPHWRQEGATYFVTFRLGDSLPQVKLNYLQRLRQHWEQTHPPPRSEQVLEKYSREVFQRVEGWLDEGYGECHFRDPRHAEQLEEALHHFHGTRYYLSCWAIMPNHCHLVIKPHEGWELEKILGGMKSTVTGRVHAITGGSGPLWQQESYDRIVRDEEHLWRVVQYIGRNPRRANLPRNQWRRWLHPEWQAAGWRFEDLM